MLSDYVLFFFFFTSKHSGYITLNGDPWRLKIAKYPFFVCSTPLATALGGYLFSVGSYRCVFATSLLLIILSAAAAYLMLRNFQAIRKFIL
jgi:hypothetical protein